jgi:hypothetical protein
MGLLECAVVVYIREIYYPAGFSFPLVMISNRIALTELLREAATVVMLMGIGYFTGKTFVTRFGSFLFAFAVWDIFYYVFLWLILGWPESLLTWDVLFLIPVMWVGPVIAPVIVSFTMIAYAFVFWKTDQSFTGVKIKSYDWVGMIAASFIIILSFTLEFINYLIRNDYSAENIINLSTHYIPAHFNWPLFIVGEIVLVLTIVLFYRRVSRYKVK